LNQLIKKVGQYTQELEINRQSLEERVQERTQELTKALGELRETQSQLIQTEKMSSLGQMVGGIAHEINNPVNFIYGNIQYTEEYTESLLKLVQLYHQKYPKPDSEIGDYVEEIDLDFLAEDLPKLIASMTMGAERIRKIVLSLKNFSRLDEAEMKKVDIHEGIDNTLLILNSRLKKNIQVVQDYGDFPLIECYPAQLNQVFMNIIANAIDALEEHNENANGCKINPVITICSCQIDVNLIKIRIGDNGPGIANHIKDKLFDPFFTTKHVGKGTGLGLSICYQIVEKHKGKIEVDSQMGKGTEFTITLPIER
ncbi:MAG: ATP-binding protein, partial [Spirulinaceae cyanobacterium]